MPKAEVEEQVATGVNTELAIVASEDVKDVLQNLTKPSVQVVVNGRVINEDGQNILIVDQIATQVNRALGIVATEETRETLVSLASARNETEVTIVGEVVENPGHNVLVLDNVVKSKSLPIMLDETVHNRLSEIVSSEGGEVPVKAKVVCDNGHKYLVLES